MEEIRKGDRVEYVGSFEGRLRGKKGTVVIVKSRDYGIKFDEDFGGHDLGGYCPNGYGWFVGKDEIKKINKFGVGDTVQLHIEPGNHPLHGWGEVENGDIGTVRYIDGSFVCVDFPKQTDWHAEDYELIKLVPEFPFVKSSLVDKMVIGNSGAGIHYSVTTKGWIGQVISEDGSRIEVCGAGGSFSVEKKHFDVLRPEDIRTVETFIGLLKALKYVSGFSLNQVYDRVLSVVRATSTVTVTVVGGGKALISVYNLHIGLKYDQISLDTGDGGTLNKIEKILSLAGYTISPEFIDKLGLRDYLED